MSCDVLRPNLHLGKPQGLRPCGAASTVRARAPDGREWLMCAVHHEYYKTRPRPGWLSFETVLGNGLR